MRAVVAAPPERHGSGGSPLPKAHPATTAAVCSRKCPSRHRHHVTPHRSPGFSWLPPARHEWSHATRPHPLVRLPCMEGAPCRALAAVASPRGAFVHPPPAVPESIYEVDVDRRSTPARLVASDARGARCAQSGKAAMVYGSENCRREAARMPHHLRRFCHERGVTLPRARSNANAQPSGACVATDIAWFVGYLNARLSCQRIETGQPRAPWSGMAAMFSREQHGRRSLTGSQSAAMQPQTLVSSYLHNEIGPANTEMVNRNQSRHVAIRTLVSPVSRYRVFPHALYPATMVTPSSFTQRSVRVTVRFVQTGEGASALFVETVARQRLVTARRVHHRIGLPRRLLTPEEVVVRPRGQRKR